MQKTELELLFTMNGKFDAFLTSNTEYKAEVKEQLTSLHAKIDKGQQDDNDKFSVIINEINDPDTGLKIRIASLERSRSSVKKGFGMIGGSSTFAAIAYNFKDKILSLFHIH